MKFPRFSPGFPEFPSGVSVEFPLEDTPGVSPGGTTGFFLKILFPVAASPRAIPVVSSAIFCAISIDIRPAISFEISAGIFPGCSFRNIFVDFCRSSSKAYF